MDTEHLIVESSVIVISIFSTVGLVIGTTSQQFKDVYSYFGYMMYFSFPFIFAAMLGMISIAALENRIKGFVSALSMSFFLTGFVVLFYLACISAQTVILPGGFVYFISLQNLAGIEVLVTILLFSAHIFAIKIGSIRRVAKHKNKVQNLLLFLGFIGTLTGAMFMSVYGVQKIQQLDETGTMLLEGAPSYKTQSVNFTLNIADEISFNLTSATDASFHYVFLDEQNYILYQNESTRFQATPIRGGYRNQIFFTETTNNAGIYYLAMDNPNPLGANVTYEVTVYHFDNSKMMPALIVMSLGVFLFLLVATYDKHDVSKSENKQSLDAEKSAFCLCY